MNSENRVSPESTESAGVVNHVLLQRFLDEEDDFAVEMVRAAMASRAKYVSSMEQALSKGDLKSFREITHEWRGLLLNMQALKLPEYLKELEVRAANDIEVEPAVMAKVETLCDQLDGVFEKVLAGFLASSA